MHLQCILISTLPKEDILLELLLCNKSCLLMRDGGKHSFCFCVLAILVLPLHQRLSNSNCVLSSPIFLESFTDGCAVCTLHWPAKRLPPELPNYGRLRLVKVLVKKSPVVCLKLPKSMALKVTLKMDRIAVWAFQFSL